MNNRSDNNASSSSRTALPFGTASAYNDTFPQPSSSSPLSAYRDKGNARRVAGVSEETLRASVQGKGEAESGGLLEVTAETCYQLSLFKGESSVRIPRIYAHPVISSAIMNEYRRFDDMSQFSFSVRSAHDLAKPLFARTVIVRLNRASAARRDENRSRGLPPTRGQDEACLKVWREMIGMSVSSLSPFLPAETLTKTILAGWQHRQRLLTFCTSTVERDLQEKQRLIQGQEPGLDRHPSASLFEEQVLVRNGAEIGISASDRFFLFRPINSLQKTQSNLLCGNVQSRVSELCTKRSIKSR